MDSQRIQCNVRDGLSLSVSELLKKPLPICSLISLIQFTGRERLIRTRLIQSST